MRYLRLSFVAICMAVLATGCVTPMPKVMPYNKVAHQNIKTIRVLAPEPVKLQVWLMNSPAGAFGLIGGLVAAGNEASRESHLHKIYDPLHFDPLAYFKSQLSEDMQARGYALVWDDLNASQAGIQRGRYMFRKNYAPSSSADAILDFEIPLYGYVAAGVGKTSPYRPVVKLNASLVSKDGKTVLFRDYYIYNNITNNETAVVVAADPAYSYPHFSDLEHAGPKSMDGLKDGIAKLAQKLASEL